MKQNSKAAISDRLPLILLFSILFAFWWTTKDIPFWWDSAGYVTAGSNYLLQNNFPSLTLGETGRTIAHPPLMMFILAFSWKIFGQSLLVAHIVNLAFASILILFTYKLGSLLSGDKFTAILIGFFSSLLLLFTPLFYAQLGIVYLDIATVSLAAPTIYFFCQKKFRLYFLFATLMLLIKETSLSVIGGLVIAQIIILRSEINLKKHKLLVLQKIFLIGSPFLVIIAWWIYHWSVMGWFFVVFEREGLPFKMVPSQIWNTFTFAFFSQYRFLLTIPIAIIIFFKQKTFFAPNVITLMSVIGAVLVFFGITEFLARYIMLTIPLIYLLFFYSLSQIIQTKSWSQTLIVFSLISLVICGLFYTSWNDKKAINSWYFPPLEDNLEYLDIISVSNQINNYLVQKHPNAHIVTSFPNTYMLTEPYQGYVKKPLNVTNCRNYESAPDNNAASPTDKTGDKVDFLIFHFFSPEQFRCMQIVEEKNFGKALRFEKNGKFMILYYSPKN